MLQDSLASRPSTYVTELGVVDRPLTGTFAVYGGEAEIEDEMDQDPPGPSFYLLSFQGTRQHLLGRSAEAVLGRS